MNFLLLKNHCVAIYYSKFVGTSPNSDSKKYFCTYTLNEEKKTLPLFFFLLLYFFIGNKFAECTLICQQ